VQKEGFAGNFATKCKVQTPSAHVQDNFGLTFAHALLSTQTVSSTILRHLTHQRIVTVKHAGKKKTDKNRQNTK
jgi:hypothetical protein